MRKKRFLGKRLLCLLLTVTTFACSLFTDFFSPQTEAYATTEYWDYADTYGGSANVKGSMGWFGKTMPLYKSASTSSTKVVSSVKRGTAFRITDTSTAGWWKVTWTSGSKTYTGYVQNKYCMINLPDVLPNIKYNITNASSAIYKSSGKSISGVTGKKLYDETAAVYNAKLGRTEYMVPVMWETAKRISVMYHNVKMLGDDYTLKIYDAYRPYKVTTTIYDKFLTLYNSNSTVKNNVNYDAEGDYWGTTWFLAKNVSKHNAGCAIDVTIVKKNSKGVWTELSMPSNMHELSTAAVKYKTSTTKLIKDGKPNTSEFAPTMNTNAKLLDAIGQGYSFKYNGKTYKFVSTGLSPLRSEWWHFQDDDTYATMKSYVSTDFQVGSSCLSKKP